MHVDGKANDNSVDSPDFENELRISPFYGIAVLPCLGVLLVLVGDHASYSSYQVKAILLALLLYALAVVAWMFESRNCWLGRWLVIVTLISVVYPVSAWLDVPALLTLMVIPTSLAGALISLPAAAVVTVGESALLLILRRVVVGVDLPAITVALIAIWSILGVMWAVFHSLHIVAKRSWQYYERSRIAVEEARERKAELEQAMEDLVHANRQLTLVNDRMAALRLIAEEARKSKAAFVARVSHEFRAPLNVIIGMVGLMVENPDHYGGEFPPMARKHLDVVYRNCNHLSSMVEDVLDLSRAETGKLTIQREWVDLATVVGGALEVVRPLLDEKRLSIEILVPEGLPRVYCDRLRVRQVILNLLSNAARFTDEGGITVEVTRQDQHVIISVKDTGPGISHEDAQKIFEPFTQAFGQPWRDEGGSGLGLSISKEFVELHCGRMWLESEIGVGSTFFVELPISKPPEHTLRPGPQIMRGWIWTKRESRPKFPESHYRSRMVICDETGELCPALLRCSDEIELVDTRDLPHAVQEVQHCPAQALLLNATSLEELSVLVEEARREVTNTPVIGCLFPPSKAHAWKMGAVDYLTKPLTSSSIGDAIGKMDTPIRSVLVVDDDADSRELLRAFLETYDRRIEIVAAESGEQALDQMRNILPDLVLLDVMLPHMNGWQVMAVKSQDENLRDIPTVMVSAQDPAKEPMSSTMLMTTLGEGISLNKLLTYSSEVSELLLHSE